MVKTVKKSGKRPLSEWNKFVMGVKKQNPTLNFSGVLKLASKMKKQGMKYGDMLKTKTRNVVKRVKKALTLKKKSNKKTRKGMKKRN